MSEDDLAHQVATLPGRLGGLGLRSAERSAPAAYWASWVDALSVIQTKAPDVAATVLHNLDSGSSAAPCLQEATAGLELLRLQGAADLPTWAEAAQGVKPPQPDEGIDAADLDRGWQCHACSTLEHYFLEHVVLPSSSSSRRSLLLSQSGGPASAWLRAIPSEPAFTLSPLRLQVALRRRLRWPLPLSGGRCCRGCNKTLDLLGDRGKLEVQEDGRGHVHVVGLKEVPVDSADAMMSLVKQASDQRSTGATSANDVSSRSHAILRVVLRDAESGAATGGCLQLCDLAGSERACDSTACDRQVRWEG